jgi:integration host factor subunit beta
MGMTKAELVDHVAATMQLPKNKTEAVITQFLQRIMDALQAGDNVELRGFGSFRLRHRQARKGRNPRTGNPVQIPAKAIPSFTPTVCPSHDSASILLYQYFPTSIQVWRGHSQEAKRGSAGGPRITRNLKRLGRFSSCMRPPGWPCSR